MRRPVTRASTSEEQLLAVVWAGRPEAKDSAQLHPSSHHQDLPVRVDGGITD